MFKKTLITCFSLILISGSLINPAKSQYKITHGEGTAAFACFLLLEGYSKDEVESLISRFVRKVKKSNNLSQGKMKQLALGYRKQIKITDNCDLKMRY